MENKELTICTDLYEGYRSLFVHHTFTGL